MPEYSFRIGDALPADDPVARFVTVLAMLHNEWRRTMDAMVATVDHPDGIGTRLMLFRQLVGHSHEAVKFLTESRAHYAEIDTFVKGLDSAVLGRYDDALAAIDGIETWLGEQRDITFHYPELVREAYQADAEVIANALAAAVDDRSSATLADTYGEVRFEFADAVAVRLLGVDVSDENTDDAKRLVKSLSDARWALGDFALGAIAAYLASRPPGTFRAGRSATD